MPLIEVAPPVSWPVTKEELKSSHLHVTGTDDDEYIQRLIAAACRRVEIETQRALARRQYRAVLDCFPRSRVIVLERPPLISVEAVTYIDWNDQTQTLAASNYKVLTASSPGRLVLKSGKSWPSVSPDGEAVTIEYTAGPESHEGVHDDLKQAIAFLVAHWYRNHEPAETMELKEIPMTLTYLTGPHRIRR